MMRKVVLSLGFGAFLAASLTFPCGSYTTQPVAWVIKASFMWKRIQHFQGNDRYGFQHNLTFKRLTKLILLATKQPGMCYNTPEVGSHIQGLQVSNPSLTKIVLLRRTGWPCTHDPPASWLQGFKLPLFRLTWGSEGQRSGWAKCLGKSMSFSLDWERDGSHLLNRLTVETLDGDL